MPTECVISVTTRIVSFKNSIAKSQSHSVKEAISIFNRPLLDADRLGAIDLDLEISCLVPRSPLNGVKLK